MPLALEDRFGRKLDYLRISVTDRCNFRCIYCMPPEGVSLLPKEDILSFEEIFRVARLFLQVGGRKIRLTGGEPLLRNNIEELVGNLARMKGLEEFSLTTNGYYLAEKAEALKKAGLQGINISIDSLHPLRFAKQTLSDGLERVRAGLFAALKAGFKTKINVVVLEGITDREILEFGLLAKTVPVEVRFIEFMPLCGTGWHPEWVVPLKKVEALLKKHFHLKPLVRGREVAQSYYVSGGEGKIGFIPSMSEPFCGNCSRLRLTADGRLRPCLFSNEEVSLGKLLRERKSDEAIIAKIQEGIRLKPEGHGVSPFVESALNLPRIYSLGG